MRGPIMWQDFNPVVTHMSGKDQDQELAKILEAGVREQCDQCSARAGIQADFPFGTLFFCRHHYNKNVEALTNRGAIAKLLPMQQDSKDGTR